MHVRPLLLCTLMRPTACCLPSHLYTGSRLCPLCSTRVTSASSSSASSLSLNTCNVAQRSMHLQRNSQPTGSSSAFASSASSLSLTTCHAAQTVSQLHNQANRQADTSASSSANTCSCRNTKGSQTADRASNSAATSHQCVPLACCAPCQTVSCLTAPSCSSGPSRHV